MRRVILFSVFIAHILYAKCEDITVAPHQSITKAIREAREIKRTKNENSTIHLLKGVHRLYEPIFIRPEDSGIAIVSNEGAVISGGVEITNWRRKGKLMVADVPDFNGRPLDFRQLWVNGRKATRARDVDSFDKMYRIINNDPEKEILWVPTKAIERVKDAPYLEMVLHEMWCVANLRVKSIEVHGDSAAIRFHNPESRIQFEHPWPRPMVTTDGYNSAFYLTNALELLDKPGEWYHDIKSGQLYYYPLSGEKIDEAIVPAIESVVTIQGTIDRPVKDILFKGVTFSHTTWMRPSIQGHVPLQAGMYLIDAYRLTPQMIRPDGNHKLDNQGWVGRPAAAVEISGGENINFDQCTFINIGSTAIDYREIIQGGTIKNSLFTDIAGSAILLGSFSPPSFEVHLPYDPSDSRVLCCGVNISNNYITNATNEDWGCVGIGAGYVRDVVIEHNEISEVSYSGISLGWGWTQSVNSMRNNRVIGNLIHHYGKHMYDVAGIYLLGAQPKTIVSNNCVHSIYTPSYVHDPNHWFYLYTDEGSSFITVKDNWTEGDKFLQNANGPGNIWENNGPLVSDSIRCRAGVIDKSIIPKVNR